MINSNGLILLRDSTYKRLPFFKRASDDIMIPKFFINDYIQSEKSGVKLQFEYCKFMRKYYEKFKGEIEIIERNPVDEIITAIFKNEPKFNLYGTLLGTNIEKYCPDFYNRYTFIDMFYTLKNTYSYLFVDGELVVIPVDYIIHSNENVVKQVKKLSGSSMSEIEFVKLIEKIHKSSFTKDKVVISFPSTIEFVPLMSYVVMVTVFNDEVSSVLLKFEGFDRRKYHLKTVSVFTSSVRSSSNFEKPVLWHFSGKRLITPVGVVKCGAVEICENYLKVNGEKIMLKLKSPVSNLVIDFC